MTATNFNRQTLTGTYAPLYCVGKRKDGTLCRQMLARVTASDTVRGIELKCPRCGTICVLD